MTADLTKQRSQGRKQGRMQGRRAGVGSIWPRWLYSAAEGLARDGVTYTNLYGMQEASGDVLDLIGSKDLTAVNSPTYSAPTPFAGRRGITLPVEVNNALRGNTSAEYDLDATTSFLATGTAMFEDTGHGGTTRDVLGKNAGTPRYGVFMLSANGRLQGNAHDGTTNYLATILRDHRDTHCRFVFNIDHGGSEILMGSHVKHDATADAIIVSTQSVAGIGTLANASTWRLGAFASSSAGFTITEMAVRLGTDWASAAAALAGVTAILQAWEGI